MNPRTERKRTTAIVLAFIAAAALGVAALGPQWLQTLPGDDHASMGLGMYQRCIESRCASVTNFKLIDLLDEDIVKIKKHNTEVKRDEQIAVPRSPWGGNPVVGLITAITSVLAAIGLVWGAILAIQRKRPDMVMLPTTLAVLGLAFAIINGCLFIATKPQMVIHLAMGFSQAVVDDMGVGWTFWTFGAGAVLGLAAVFPLNRQIRPIDEELGAASATMSWGTSRDEE